MDQARARDARELEAELERCWVEQARRAKDICDLLEQRLRLTLAHQRPCLSLVQVEPPQRA